MLPSVQKSKAYLQDPKRNGVSIYSHLTEVLADMLEAQTPNALESLESFSMKMKDSCLSKELMDPTAPVWEPVRVSSGTWHESANKLLNVPTSLLPCENAK